MKIRSSHSILTRIFAFAIACHVLNFSIDPRDPNPNTVPEDLSINDIESFTEFFAEVVLDFKDAFKESDECDSDDSGIPDFFEFYFSNQAITIDAGDYSILALLQFSIQDSHSASSLSLGVQSPPPKA